MELIRSADVTVLSNSGVQSHQLLFPENSASSRVTITKVIVAPGAVNPRHQHETIAVGMPVSQHPPAQIRTCPI